MIITETKHLQIRRFETSDAGFVLELLNTPGWIQYIGDKNIKTIAEAENYILSGPVKSYKKSGFGLYLVALKDSGKSVGMCGLIKRDTLEDVDVGVAFLPEQAGKGYAYEAVAAVLEHAKNDFNIQRIVAITLHENKSCIRLLEKAGLVFEKDIQFPGETEVLMLFGKTL